MVTCSLLALAVTGYFAAISTRYRGKVTVTIERQRILGDSVILSVLASNHGPGTLMWSDSPFMEARFQVGGTWTNSYRGRGVTRMGLLVPGEVVRGEFSLPRNTIRCQVDGYFEYAGPRGTVMAHMINSGWWNRLFPVSQRVIGWIPRGHSEVVEFWSKEVGIVTED